MLTFFCLRLNQNRSVESYTWLAIEKIPLAVNSLLSSEVSVLVTVFMAVLQHFNSDMLNCCGVLVMLRRKLSMRAGMRVKANILLSHMDSLFYLEKNCLRYVL